MPNKVDNPHPFHIFIMLHKLTYTFKFHNHDATKSNQTLEPETTIRSIGHSKTSQEFIDIVETVYRRARKGRGV